ncbi:hypothetical protein DFAR_3760019 [Desulfarculales bacterium]
MLLRCARLSLALILPTLLLPWLCALAGQLFNSSPRRLLRMQALHHQGQTSLKVWFLRPLSGIGLAMLLLWRLLVAIFC